MSTTTDLRADGVDWAALLGAVADAENFTALLDPVYESGVLVSRYDPDLLDDIDEVVDSADVATLRSLLTAIVRRDRFDAGSGDDAY